MLVWIQKKCFTNLEADSQKNNLLLFVFVVSVILGEMNVVVNTPFFSQQNIMFLIGVVLVLLSGFALNRVTAIIPLYKYIMMFVLTGFAVLQLYIFNDYPAVFQVIYFNLAIALIYLNGRLIIFVGALSLALTLFGHLFWRTQFFPWSDISLMNIPLGLLAETTLVLWAATRIGTSYNIIVDSNQRMKQLLRENEEQFEIIQRQNNILEQYANQVEQLTVREERDRIAKELHDTVGHTATSLILGMETTKHLLDSDREQAIHKLDTLIAIAQNSLSELRQNVYQSAFVEKSTGLSDQFITIIEKFSESTGTKIDFTVVGEEFEVPQNIKFVLIRCVQESLTNALRHGKSTTAILIKILFLDDRVKLLVKDNGIGFDEVQFGFGLSAMKERVESLRGELDISSLDGTGATILITIPFKQEPQQEQIKVLIVDDKEFVRESFRILLSTDSSLTVVDTAQNGFEALEMCSKHSPDVILMDIHMPELGGVETTRRIKEKWPNIKVIMLTTFGEMQFAVEAINAGAEGYLIKSNNPKNIAKAVRLVYSGGNLISQDMAKMLVSNLQKEAGPSERSLPTLPEQAHSLKDRELQILRCLTQGLRSKEISAKLDLSEGTIRNYISSIYSKLEVQSREEATKKAKEKGII